MLQTIDTWANSVPELDQPSRWPSLGGQWAWVFLCAAGLGTVLM